MRVQVSMRTFTRAIVGVGLLLITACTGDQSTAPASALLPLPPASRPAKAPGAWAVGHTADAIRAGTLQVIVEQSKDTIGTFERVEVRFIRKNNGSLPVSIPSFDSPAVELQSLDHKGVTYRWERPLPPSPPKLLTIAPGSDTGTLYTALWFATEKLTGRPANQPFLPLGKYRWRLVMRDIDNTPALTSNWLNLTVADPTPSPAAAAAAKLRPNGRFIYVSNDRQPPAPNGTLESPYGTLSHAARAAKPGDLIFLDASATFYVTDPFALDKDVWLIGAGAASTVIYIWSTADDGQPLVDLRNNAHVEGVTLNGARGPAGAALVRAQGEDVSPTIARCMLIPHEKAFATIHCLDGAAPEIRASVICSPVGEYAVFARDGSRPKINYCTIFSRGFGVGMLDSSVPLIRHCIIAGARPAVISDDGEFELRDSLVYCPQPGPHKFAVFRWRIEEDPATKQSRTVEESMDDLLTARGMSTADPRFAFKGDRVSYFTPANDAARAYGAFADADHPWGKAAKPSQLALPDLARWLP